MRSQAHRVLAEVFRDARRSGWRVENPWHRHPLHAYAWINGPLRVSLQTGPAGARLTIRHMIDLNWTVVAQCQVGAWQQVLSILEAYAIIAFRHLPVYQRGVRDGRRELATPNSGS